MKKISLIILALGLSLATFAQEKQLSALFGYSTFYLPESNQPYVETYLNFDAWTLNFVEEESGQYRATVEITIAVRRGDTIAYLKKYDYHSPYTSSAENNTFTCFDLQRFGLANGIYDMEISIKDKTSSKEPFVLKDKLIIYFSNQKPALSNIQLMASATPTEQTNIFSRNGYDMMPYINDFVPANITHLNPYFEIYNLDKEIGDKAFAVETHIERKENSRTVEGTRQRLEFDHTAQNRPVYTNIDISQLASGNYNLVVEVLSTDNQVYMSDAVAFQRSNPIVKENKLANVPVETSFAALITDEKELNYYLDALYPVASPEEVTVARALIKTAGLTEKQNFFFHFWERRNELDPQGEWNKYHELLKYVDATYSYPKTPGYMTDRGRVYLQYGPPDFIRDEKNFVGTSGILNHTSRYTEHDMKQYQHANDKTSSTGHIYYLPYQLWRYNLIAGDGRYRVFLFWDEFRSGYYKLLNSNAKGELQTPMWERVLSGGQLPEDAMGEVGEQFARGY